MLIRSALAAVTVVIAHHALVGPMLYPENHAVVSCAPSRDAELVVNPGPDWLRAGFERAGVAWRAELPPAPSTLGSTLFSSSTATTTPPVPTATYETARSMLQVGALTLVGALGIKGTEG